MKQKKSKKKEKVLEPEVLASAPKTKTRGPAKNTLVPALAPGRAVTAKDPLQRYLEEIRRYELIDPEEQQAMAIKFRATGDRSLARALVTANLRLVVKIAMEYRSAYNNVLDLIQEGNVGLMKAVANYDPYKGTRLSYYASWWIRSYILKFLLDNFRLVKVGTTQAQKKLFYNLMREKERLEAQGIQAGPKLLADNLNVREKDVQEMSLRLSSRGGEVSIDRPVQEGSDRGPTHADSLADGHEGVDESLAKQQLEAILSDHVGEFTATLNEKERILFQERLMSEEPKTLQEVADKFGITRERARQIEARVVEKLREHMSVHIDGLPLKPRKDTQR